MMILENLYTPHASHGRFAKRRAASYGFSLLEMLLALAVMAVVLMGILNIMRDYTEREVARTANAYMTKVMDNLEVVLDDPRYFMALYNAAGANGYQMVMDADSAGANNLLNNLTLGGVLISKPREISASFKDWTPVRAQMRILIGRANTAGQPPALNVLIVTRTPRPLDIIRKTANYGGFHAGYITSYSSKANATIENNFNSWNLRPINGFSNTDWYRNDLPNSLNPNTTGTFLAYYKYFNYQSVVSDYLYRVPDTYSGGELNTMHTPLNLNGRNIVGADDVQISGTPFATMPAADDGACVGAVACIVGTTVVKGSAVVSNNLNVTGSAAVEGSAQVSAMRIQNAMPESDLISSSGPRNTYQAEGHLIVNSSASSAPDLVNIRGNANFKEGAVVTTGNATASATMNAVNMPSGGQFHANTVDTSGKIIAGGIHASSMHARGIVKTREVIAGDVTFTGRTGAIRSEYIDRVTVGQVGSPGNISVPHLQVDRLSIQNFGACDDCPQ